MYVNGAPELGETLFIEEIWKNTLIETEAYCCIHHNYTDGT